MRFQPVNRSFSLANCAVCPRKNGACVGAFLVALVFGTLSQATAQTVTLNLAVSTGDTIDGYTIGAFINGTLSPGIRPDINDSGTLAFWANTPGSNYGYFTQSASLAHYGDVIDGNSLEQLLGSLGSINSSGLAAFDWSYNDTSLNFR